jgi:hypothetical protein
MIRKLTPKPTALTEDEMRNHGLIDQPLPEEMPTRITPRAQRQSYLPETIKALPQSLDAEKGVLSSIMNAAIKGSEIGRKAMFYAEQQIGANHFHLPAHKVIWRAIQSLHKDNEPLNFIAITEELDGSSALDQCGGAEYVTEIGTFLPTHANLDYYVQILQEKHALRQIAELGTRLTAAAYEQGQSDPGFLLDEAANTLKAIKTAKRIGELPELDDMTDLLGENMPPAPDELVKGVLHRGSKLIIGGTSKGRKTFSLIDLAISVSTGTDWWGLSTIKGKVCYINFEIQRPFFARRFADICKKKNVMPDPGMFKCWTLRGFSEGLEKMSANLIKILLQQDYVLIVFDPIYKALGDRDENKAGDVASMLNELEAIAVKTGAAIAFGAHYSKGNQASKDAMDRIGGSGVFARDPDAILTMTPHSTEECFTVDTTLRNFPPQKPFVLKWEWPLFERDETEDPDDLKKPKNVRAPNTSGQFGTKYTLDMILNAVKEADEDRPTGRSATELQAIMKRDTGMSPATFWRLWNEEAKKSPYLILKNKRWFHIESLTNQ